MGSQIYPSGSKQCAKWAQGYGNDMQSGPKRPQMVLRGRLKWSQRGTRRSLKGPQTYKQINKKHVVENWRAFRHVVQCLSKWNPGRVIKLHIMLIAEAYPEGGLSSKVYIYTYLYTMYIYIE